MPAGLTFEMLVDVLGSIVSQVHCVPVSRTGQICYQFGGNEFVYRHLVACE
jgi:hypothetical protein